VRNVTYRMIRVVLRNLGVCCWTKATSQRVIKLCASLYNRAERSDGDFAYGLAPAPDGGYFMHIVALAPRKCLCDLESILAGKPDRRVREQERR
jgi:hypothetical protein